LSLTPHKASPPQPNGTFAEYVDKEEGVEADLQEFQDFDEFVV
jgi:hypothetical protein